MAKPGKVLPARRPRGEESLLIRSAEALGRAIGRLQRQLEQSGSAAPGSAPDGNGAPKVRRASNAKKKTAAKRAMKPPAKKK